MIRTTGTPHKHTVLYIKTQYRAGKQLWRCHNNVQSPRSVSWSSLCPNSTWWALWRVLFTSILLLIRNSLCLLFSQDEQNDIKSSFSSRGSPNGWTDAWGTIKERRKSFISLHITSGIDFGVLEGYLAFRNFVFELAPTPQRYDFTLKLSMNSTVSYRLCVPLCTNVQVGFPLAFVFD